MSVDAKYVEIIKSGGVVAFPTETVYGLGADAKNFSAIQKVFETKGRPSDNPLIVHVSDLEQLSEFASDISETAQKLIQNFWPGPLTLVFKKKEDVLDIITAGLDTVAVRMPNHKLALDLIQKTGALVAPSANKSGKPSPTHAKHVLEDFGSDFPVIDGGATEIGLESTVLNVSKDTLVLLRPGKIGKSEIESFLRTEIEISDTLKEGENPKSPGQKYAHYKPKAKVVYGKVEEINSDTLYLMQSDKFQNSSNIIHYSGDLNRLSKELYDRFRQADLENYEAIFIEDFIDYKRFYTSIYSALINRIQKTL